jgi:hypothetical protein
MVEELEEDRANISAHLRFKKSSVDLTIDFASYQQFMKRHMTGMNEK